MKISKIETQKKNKNRCSLYINGEYYCGLSKEIVIKYDLQEGDDISDEDLERYIKQEELARIKGRAYHLLSYRCRSVQELKMRLLEKDYDESFVDEVITEFLADKTLDDEVFTEVFVADYTRLKPRGNIFLKKELAKKGVDRSIIERVTEQRDECPLILAFLKKKFPGLKKDDFKQLQKARRQLFYRGFSPPAVQDALRIHTGAEHG